MTETLQDHCIAWYTKQHILYGIVPTELQKIMYECWVNYAFAGFGDAQ
ncbi:MAG: hypothetical protein M0Q91_17370 [Methanoregula sp.]|jgi:hypothetical protein|nr:hypothetical protein [Methanoregula sp.]